MYHRKLSNNDVCSICTVVVSDLNGDLYVQKYLLNIQAKVQVDLYQAKKPNVCLGQKISSTDTIYQ